MTNTISTLEPNLYLVGLYIQENALKGYKLVEGYPMTSLWQYEVMMEKAGKPAIEQPTPERAKLGRPKATT